MEMWSIMLGLFIGFLSYLILLKPLIPLVYLKIKYGDAALFRFVPILGILALSRKSFKEHNDVSHYHRYILSKHPKTKILLTNLGISPLIVFYHPE